MDIDVPSRYKSAPPNGRSANFPPRVPTGPGDRRGREMGIRDTPYHRESDRDGPRDWITKEEVAPRAPRAMSSRSGGPSPVTTAMALPPASASTNADQTCAPREISRRASSTRSDDEQRTSYALDASSNRETHPSLPAQPHKRHSRFGGKVPEEARPIEAEDGHVLREPRNVTVPATTSVSVVLSRGSSYNDAPSLNSREKVILFDCTRRVWDCTDTSIQEGDDPDYANPFEDEKRPDELIEEKRSKVRTVFQDIVSLINLLSVDVIHAVV